MAAYGGRDFYSELSSLGRLGRDYELSKIQDEEEPNFLEQPSGRYYCLICHSVMRDPHIVMCCCKKMCGGCIERVQHSGQPCPNCRKPDFVMYPERDLNSEILDLKVRCTHHTNGCEWVGELRDLKKHTDPEKGKCGFIQVKCPYGCPVAYLCHESDSHESVCPNLPPELQIKRTMRATDQFKEELQVTLERFQELYKLESKRVRELTDQLETMKENRKKEEQKMKHQFEAEKKQLLDECRTEYQQQIKLLTERLREDFTQEMNKFKTKSEEEHQQQMVSLKQRFEKEIRLLHCKEMKGNQPVGGTMAHSVRQTSLPGYEGAGTIEIIYTIPGGVQTTDHPNPGQLHHGTVRKAYLPNTPEGQEILALLKKAFDARLIFTVGTSRTTGQTNTVIWNGIHHKTMTHGEPYGYPDPAYLARIREDLKAKGIE